MSGKTKAAAMRAAPNRWLVFCILTFSGGIAFKLSSMKDMFYVPMQQFMGLTNTQIGGALSGILALWGSTTCSALLSRKSLNMFFPSFAPYVSQRL